MNILVFIGFTYPTHIYVVVVWWWCGCGVVVVWWCSGGVVFSDYNTTLVNSRLD